MRVLVVVFALSLVGCGENPENVCRRLARDVCARVQECRPDTSFAECVRSTEEIFRCDDVIRVAGDVDACEVDIARQSCAEVGAAPALCDELTLFLL